ncbi:cation diffusion facilitator family transporter [Alcanivorax sp. JB21]|uniref:cation diffusion facilitator family transporter n=1 Tax=Alcanivorax limicola TaxID=2874102 RepID=UPI001CBD655E|nr:cation diffusion facilitator family transporter [Alcanivorax limicola]MBZ2189424.1 cation diffusion facilitator family transporter [Alcanivorax limicola]
MGSTREHTTPEQATLKLSIGMTLVVAGLGIALGLLSGSQSILFDGMFSTIDAAMSLLALFVSRLLMREGSRRFQYGYWHMEPLVAALNGSILLLLCVYAFFNAVGGLIDGGRELAFDIAIGYAVVVSVVCFSMYLVEKRVNRRVNSEFLRIDTQSWLMAGLITFSLLIAFIGALFMADTPAAPLIPYIDSLLLVLLTLCFMPVPIGIVRRAMSEILIVAPNMLDQEVRNVMARIMKRDGLIDYYSHVAKSGRIYFIEIHIVTRGDFGVDQGVQALDMVRAEITAGLEKPDEKRWITVAFTANPDWA